MNRAQGNTRKAPDGFLHIQNYTVTKASGMAGIVWQLLSPHQKEVFEGILVERALACEAAAGIEWTGSAVRDDKHGCMRFGKAFLKTNFQASFHDATRVMAIPVLKVFQARLFRERDSLR